MTKNIDLEVQKESVQKAEEVSEVVTKINQLREDICNVKECIADRLTQYQSETHMFGDAGPGQHPSLWQDGMEDVVMKYESDLELLYKTPEGIALLAKEKEERDAFIDKLYANSPADDADDGLAPF